MGHLADLRKGCEQVGRDYIVSWCPNPTMVSTGFDEGRIRKAIQQGLKDSFGCNMEILLNDFVKQVHSRPISSF